MDLPGKGWVSFLQGNISIGFIALRFRVGSALRPPPVAGESVAPEASGDGETNRFKITPSAGFF